MSIIQLDLLNFIPDALKTAARDTLVDFVSDQAKKVVGEELGRKLKQLRSDAAFNKQFEKGLESAIRRFVAEYELEDEDLVIALAADPTIFQNDTVQKALLIILKKPGAFLEPDREKLVQSFESVLPNRRNRERVDRAVTFLLQCLAEELWHLPELQPVYSLQFQRVTAEAARTQVELQKAQLLALTELNVGLRDALLQLTDAIGERKQLPAGGNLALPEPLPRPKVYHNLPQPDYGRFIGREQELAQVYRILRPYPHSQHALVTIDGIGGIGKSALALEVAHHYLHEYEQINQDQRFDAIIWTSAKQTTLTAEGIVTRPQALRTLDDIYSTIAIALQREDITRARAEEQPEVVRNALTRQRTLLIVDNLETVDDEDVLTFLRELPAPTKAIVTTRHRIDVAYPVRMKGMTWDDAQRLIEQESNKKQVKLSQSETQKLFDRTGGVPLAIVWSMAQMGFGYGVDTVLHRLGEPTGDVAKFCFEGAIDQIRSSSSYTVMLALALFVTDASRKALRFITELSEMDLDDSLVSLDRLSLINKSGDRFAFLPLTKSFVFQELHKSPDLEKPLRKRWVDYFKLSFPYSDDEMIWHLKGEDFFKEGENIREALEWCYAEGSSEDVFDLTLLVNDFFDDVGWWREMFYYYEHALTLARSVQHPIRIIQLALRKGWLLEQWGQLKDSLASNLEAQEQAKKNQDKKSLGKAYQRLSAVYRKLGNLPASIEFCDQAYQIALDTKERNLELLILHEYGKIARAQEDWENAHKYFSMVQEAFEKIAEETPHDQQLARGVAGHLAIVEFHLGNPQKAKELCLRSLEFFEGHGTRGYLGVLKYRLALAEEALGDYESARLHVTEALDWFDRLGMKPDYQEAVPLLERLMPKNQGETNLSEHEGKSLPS